MDNTVNNSSKSNIKTSISEKISYGMGDVACNVVFALTSGLVVYFYTNVMGISAAMVGTIIMCSKLFDGFTDFAIGFIVDKVHSKHGRARAWVLWMAIPYAVSAILLFSIPAESSTLVQAIYIFITYNLCTTVVYTALNLPYGLMAPLMTTNEKDIATINIFRMSMSPIAFMIVSACSFPLINWLGGGQAAWIQAITLYSIIAIACLAWCFWGTKERVNMVAATEAEKLPVKEKLKLLFQNKYFINLTLASIALGFYQNFSGTGATYYAQYILGNNEYFGSLTISETIPKIIGIIAITPLIVKYNVSKRDLVLLGAILIVLAQLTFLITDPDPTTACIIAAIRGLGQAPLFGLMFTMMADVVNYGHWKTGIRLQAVVFSAFTIGQKVGGGFSSAAIGWLMGSSGFTGLENEIPSAIKMTNDMYIWGITLSWLVIAIFMWRYKLDKTYTGMMKEMEAKGMTAEI
ncbi:MFS transporter [Vibrio sp. MA40-2]|uniref:MFS transporter n=1 Tax=Vibrio sp. MA40-2 TaxID=3391828 RepID=UPI0039A4B8D3